MTTEPMIHEADRYCKRCGAERKLDADCNIVCNHTIECNCQQNIVLGYYKFPIPPREKVNNGK